MTQLTSPSSTAPSRTPSAAVPIRIITHNIRYAAPPSQRLPHERPWSSRCISLCQQLHFLSRHHFSPTHSIVCLQEVLTEQLNDIQSSLGNTWTAYGVGRDNGKNAGERCPIFWRSSAWDCLHAETVWLNETGEVGRKGWDAESVRVVSCVVLLARVVAGEGTAGAGTNAGPDAGANAGAGADRKLLVMNTHLDNAGAVARRESAKILFDVQKTLRKDWNVDASIMVGDLNSEIDGDAYKILNGERSGLKDALTFVHEEGSKRYGDYGTFTGFDGKGDGEDVKRIDFVFVPKQDSQVEQEQIVQGYATMSNLVNRSRMSDHQAVVVDMMV